MENTPTTKVGAGSTSDPLFSLFAGDADMMELVEFFVEELQKRVDAIKAATAEGDRAGLKRIAHQLKGSGGGYGFPDITALAGQLESSLASEEMEMSALSEQIESLIDLCQRVTASDQ